MFKIPHSPSRSGHRAHRTVRFAAPIVAVLAALVVFTMLPHRPGEPQAKLTDFAAPAAQLDGGPPAGWFSSTEPLPNVQD